MIWGGTKFYGVYPGSSLHILVWVLCLTLSCAQKKHLGRCDSMPSYREHSPGGVEVQFALAQSSLWSAYP